MEKFPCIAGEFGGNKEIQLQYRCRCRNTSTSCPSSVWLGLPTSPTSARSMQRTPESKILDVLPSNAPWADCRWDDGHERSRPRLGNSAKGVWVPNKLEGTDILFDGFAVNFGRLLWIRQGCRTIMTRIPHGAAGFSLLQCHPASCIECMDVVV